VKRQFRWCFNRRLLCEPYRSFFGCPSQDANLYIHDSAAGGYPILNYDDETVTKDENMVWETRIRQKIQNNFIAANWEGLSRSKINSTRILNNIAELIKLNKRSLF
jgi:hypothetical protein